MPLDEATIKIDRAACLKGGSAAGEYLDKLGKSDLANLNEEEWAYFCQILVGTAFMSAFSSATFEAPPF